MSPSVSSMSSVGISFNRALKQPFTALSVSVPPKSAPNPLTCLLVRQHASSSFVLIVLFILDCFCQRILTVQLTCWPEEGIPATKGADVEHTPNRNRFQEDLERRN
jgi:hypothetical protein